MKQHLLYMQYSITKQFSFLAVIFSLLLVTTIGISQIEVLSFNVRVDVDGGNKAWSSRKWACFDVANNVNPDFMGIQEALPHQASDMDAAMPGFSKIGRGRESNGGGEGSQIFYRNANWELQSENGTFQLSPTPDVPGSNGWGFGYLRICTFGRFKNKQTGQYVYIYNTHYPLDGNGRTNCSNLIADRIANRSHTGDPVILMGDFNANEGEYSMLIFKGASGSPVNMTEAWREINPTETNQGTFSGWNHTPNGGAKIDHIYSLGHSSISEAEYLFPNPGQVVSDHFPIRAVINYGAVVIPPTISNIAQSPTYPKSSDPINVTATITDDGAITSAILNWGTSSGNLSNAIGMNANGSTYSVQIPAQNDGTFLYYQITATDNDGQTTTSNEIVIQIQDNPQRLFADFDNIDLNFDGFGGSNFSEASNPDKNGINVSSQVGKTTKGSETWAGIYSNILTPSVDFVQTPRFRIKVWAPKTGDLIVKFEDGIDSEHFYEKIVPITTVNAWTEISIDFSMAPSGEFEKLVLFFDYDSGAQDTYYFDDIRLTESTVTSTNDFSSETKIQLFPNPATTVIEVTGQQTDSEIVVLNSIGRITYQGSNPSIDCSNWSSGIYSVMTTANNNTFTKTFIKQ